MNKRTVIGFVQSSLGESAGPVTPLVMDTEVFVAGVFWRHEPHRCVQAWLRGIVTLVVSDPILTPRAWLGTLTRAQRRQLV